MGSKSRLAYALAAVAALAFGLGVSLWRSAASNETLVRANLTQSLALEAAQDEVKAIREKLRREIKDRQLAEAAQEIAQESERAARQALEKQAKATQSAEAALAQAAAELKTAQSGRMRAEAALQAASGKLARQAGARWAAEAARAKAEASLQAASDRLEQESAARQGADAALAQAQIDLASLTEGLKQEIAARNAAQHALAEVEDRARLLEARLAGGTAADAAGGAAKADAAAGNGTLRAIEIAEAPPAPQGASLPAGDRDRAVAGMAARQTSDAASENQIVQIQRPSELVPVVQ